MNWTRSSNPFLSMSLLPFPDLLPSIPLIPDLPHFPSPIPTPANHPHCDSTALHLFFLTLWSRLLFHHSKAETTKLSGYAPLPEGTFSHFCHWDSIIFLVAFCQSYNCFLLMIWTKDHCGISWSVINTRLCFRVASSMTRWQVKVQQEDVLSGPRDRFFQIIHAPLTAQCQEAQKYT